jgi:hypothetical protein
MTAPIFPHAVVRLRQALKKTLATPGLPDHLTAPAPHSTLFGIDRSKALSPSPRLGAARALRWRHSLQPPVRQPISALP